MSMISNLQDKGLYRAFMDQVVGLEPILQAMSDRGVPVNTETDKESERYKTSYSAVEEMLKKELVRFKLEMAAMVPPELPSYHVYKRAPKVVKEAHFQVDVAQTDGSVKKEWRRWTWVPSNKQLCKYMRFKGHDVPQSKKGTDTTAVIEVIGHWRKYNDPMYKKVIDYRKAHTILTNHMKNWRPGPDGRVHTTFYTDPATGQLSSRRPNVQNAPAKDDPEFGGYAKVFRNMIEAAPDHTLIEFDYKSFHAQTLGFESMDEAYLRLAKLDIHSFLAARLVRDKDYERCLSWPDDKLSDYLKWIKKNYEFVRNKKAKPAILGYGFGMGYGKLYNLNRESFENMWEAKNVLVALDRAFPIAKAWRDAIRAQASDQGYLISRWGYIRYFWEVNTWKNGRMQPGGEDSEAAIAFLPANNAFGQMRWVMREVEQRGWSLAYKLFNNIHDSLMFECPDSLLAECRSNIYNVMSAPSLVLINKICPKGLAVEVEMKQGKKWGSM